MNTLYKMFSQTNELLYVGISMRPISRFKEHSGDKEWFAEISRIDLSNYLTREESLRAEAEAIKTLKPKYNKALAERAGYGARTKRRKGSIRLLPSGKYQVRYTDKSGKVSSLGQTFDSIEKANEAWELFDDHSRFDCPNCLVELTNA